MSVASALPKGRREREIHPESLLKLTLVRQMIMDQSCSIRLRNVDQTWFEEKVIPISVSGFNPALSSVFIASRSTYSRWMQDPYSSARWYNERDRLIRNLLFAVHDYLHCWAYQAINEIVPELEFGMAEVTAENFEDMVFCHLISEVVAVVGLDYWYLSTFDLNELCPIGTTVQNLTVSFRQENESEYRRWGADFSVQSPEFFKKLATFYCEGGAFLGVRQNGLERNPMTYHWLNHEMKYGAAQRKFSRMWIDRFAREGARISPTKLSGPVKIDQPWQEKVIDGVASLLWEKVKEDKLHHFTPRLEPGKSWKSLPSREVDFRFINIHAATPAEIASIASGRDSDVNFAHFFFQYVSQFEYENFDKQLIKLFPALLTSKDAELVRHLFRAERKVPHGDEEPRDLFILN